MTLITDRLVAVEQALAAERWPVPICRHAEPGGSMPQVHICPDHTDRGLMCPACWASHNLDEGLPEHENRCQLCSSTPTRLTASDIHTLGPFPARTPNGLVGSWQGEVFVAAEPNVCERCWARLDEPR